MVEEDHQKEEGRCVKGPAEMCDIHFIGGMIAVKEETPPKMRIRKLEAVLSSNEIQGGRALLSSGARAC